MEARETGVRLEARSGRAVLVGDAGTEGALDPAALGLPDSLVATLRQWARAADTVARHARPSAESTELVASRGRQLAARLAWELDCEVDYVDPTTGTTVHFGAGAHRPVPDPEPTPWATGLTVSAVVAAVVTIALVVLTSGLADVNGWLALVVNLSIVAGFAPSIWLGSRFPVWRWVAFGAALGIVIGWFALLLSTLG